MTEEKKEPAGVPPAPPESADPVPGDVPADVASDGSKESRLRVVGVGASAGGLEALTELFQALRPDSGMAFGVVSHLDPEHKSALAEILSRVCPMPVIEAEDGMTVEPN